MNVMKFCKKKILNLLPLAIIPVPVIFVASCSNKSSFEASTSPSLYSSIFNGLQNKDIKDGNFLELTVSELETKINNEIKANRESDLLMKVYSFYTLWQAFKSPLTESGSTQTNLSSEIQEYTTFLENKMAPDDKNVQENSKKKYNNFRNYINSFDYKISIYNFKNNSIDPNETLLNLFANGAYILNFQFDFWTNDEETNSKIISKKNSSKSIIFKNSISRSDRETIRKIRDEKIKNITTNQFAYQSTKLYYDVEQKRFSTIILPSNVHLTVGNDETPNSGYASSDKTRKLFAFEFYSESQKSKTFKPNLNLLLNFTDNFSYSITTDWTNFLEQEKIYAIPEGKTNKEMKNIKINIGRDFYFDFIE